jgi:3-oxoacyl-[acyl-carrier protein] reductase
VASKAAIIGLTKSFAKAGAPHGVLANCVSPGQIDTPMTSTFPPDKVVDLTRAIPLRRMGTAQEVADVIAFLVGPGASYITGATIPVNGGFLMP